MWFFQRKQTSIRHKTFFKIACFVGWVYILIGLCVATAFYCRKKKYNASAVELCINLNKSTTLWDSYKENVSEAKVASSNFPQKFSEAKKHDILKASSSRKIKESLKKVNKNNVKSKLNKAQASIKNVSVKEVPIAKEALKKKAESNNKAKTMPSLNITSDPNSVPHKSSDVQTSLPALKKEAKPKAVACKAKSKQLSVKKENQSSIKAIEKNAVEDAFINQKNQEEKLNCATGQEGEKTEKTVTTEPIELSFNSNESIDYNQNKHQIYGSQIKSEILKNWKIPRGLEDYNYPRVRFYINKRGSVESFTIIQSSGNKSLDQSLKSAIYKAQFKELIIDQWVTIGML